MGSHSISISAAVPLPCCSYSHSILIHTRNQNPHFQQKHSSFVSHSLFIVKNHSQFNDLCVSSLTLTPSPTTGSHNLINKAADYDPSGSNNLFQHFYLSSNSEDTPNRNPRRQTQKQDREGNNKKSSRNKGEGLLTNMWWVNLKAALGQRLNTEGIISSVAVVVKDRHLAVSHVVVPDVRYIDWAELQKRGFKGVVFDKDNTITAPYCLTLWPPLEPSIEQCKSVFGQDIAVFSNSAGLDEYDHDGSKARALEGAIGIRVIRHKVKKPAGNAEEIEKHFGLKSSQLVMVGDRPFTDIVYGNRNGFLTVLTEPLSSAGETFVVRQVRKLEGFLVKCWIKAGIRPISHNLLPDTTPCVKDP